MEFSNLLKAVSPKDIASVMDGTISESKGWFLLVRQLRENIKDRRTEDEFSDPKISLRAWVCL